MPNRIIKESICTSDSIDQLTAFQETLFYRLIVRCDDYGRFDGRPKIISSSCFPLRDIRTQQIEEALRALTSAELVTLYQVGGKPFLQMKTWDRHQQIRAKRSKYPAPDGEMNTSDIICNQMISSDSKCLRNPIQSNPKKEDEEEDEQQLPRTRELADAWKQETGKAAAPALLKRLLTNERICEFEPGVLETAIQIAAVKSQNPSSYILTLCQDWQREKIKTVAQAEEYLVLRDQVDGKMLGVSAEMARENMRDFRDRQNESQRLDRLFDAFWAMYPLKVAKARAYEQFMKTAPDEKTVERMILALKQQQQRGGAWSKSASAWLRDHDWTQADGGE